MKHEYERNSENNHSSIVVFPSVFTNHYLSGRCNSLFYDSRFSRPKKDNWRRTKEMQLVDYETLREALKEVCKTYNLHESIIESVFMAISEKKKQYLENIQKINKMISFLKEEFQKTDDKGKVALSGLLAFQDQGFSEEEAQFLIKIAKAGEKI